MPGGWPRPTYFRIGLSDIYIRRGMRRQLRQIINRDSRIQNIIIERMKYLRRIFESAQDPETKELLRKMSVVPGILSECYGRLTVQNYEMRNSYGQMKPGWMELRGLFYTDRDLSDQAYQKMHWWTLGPDMLGGGMVKIERYSTYKLDDPELEGDYKLAQSLYNTHGKKDSRPGGATFAVLSVAFKLQSGQRVWEEPLELVWPYRNLADDVRNAISFSSLFPSAEMFQRSMEEDWLRGDEIVRARLEQAVEIYGYEDATIPAEIPGDKIE